MFQHRLSPDEAKLGDDTTMGNGGRHHGRLSALFGDFLLKYFGEPEKLMTANECTVDAQYTVITFIFLAKNLNQICTVLRVLPSNHSTITSDAVRDVCREP